MAHIIETPVHLIDELAPEARDRARDWYRTDAVPEDWYDVVLDDFAAICGLLGVRLKTRRVPLFGGGYRKAPCIWFSGFASQGDGACFEGVYAYMPHAVACIRCHAPDACDLHDIAARLQAIQRRNFYQLVGDIRHKSRYYHENSMEISVERDAANAQPPTPDAEAVVDEALRDLARWLYLQLDAEYDSLTSDTAVDEALAANAVTFTADGVRFG